MRFDDRARLLQPETLPYQNGIERLADGILHVATLTRMPGVTSAMIAWWFGEYMRTTEHYRRWHPRDHVWMDWADKRSGTHVGASHLVHEYIGGQLNKLRIHFVPPEEWFDAAAIARPGFLAICARTGMLDRPLDMGRLVHAVTDTAWGCEMHSRFWLGDVAVRGGSLIPEMLGNRPWVRRRFLPSTLGRALETHCFEEMTTLAGFLPALYRAETGSQA